MNSSTVLITGGTGSFGTYVAKQLFDNGPREIRIFSRDEKKQWEMRKQFPDLRYFVGDVRDQDRLYEAMKGVDYVFHAAALKQVPSCEQFPFEAVKTNIIGTQLACQAAAAHSVKAFVALSTDKAVKPVNAMGASKAMMEKIVCSQNEFGSATRFCCVRYGNVVGSRGSVIPLFREQIAKNQPITVTVPTMTRFLLTLAEAMDLVLHAMQHACGGEIFVRKAPACTVQLLAEAMRLKYSPRAQQHPIQVLGIRPGEKLHEALVNEYEMQRLIEEDSYFTVLPEYRCSEIVQSGHRLGTEYTSENTEQLTEPHELAPIFDSLGDLETYV